MVWYLARILSSCLRRLPNSLPKRPGFSLISSMSNLSMILAKVFSITLARRGTFTVSVASAEWGETSSWEMMLALAQQRL